MNVLVCICSNIWQFSMNAGMIHACYHTIVCTDGLYFANTSVFLCYKTGRGALVLAFRIRVTLHVVALLDTLLGQATWTETLR